MACNVANIEVCDSQGRRLRRDNATGHQTEFVCGARDLEFFAGSEQNLDLSPLFAAALQARGENQTQNSKGSHHGGTTNSRGKENVHYPLSPARGVMKY